MDKTVSLLVCTLNRADDLRKCIDSLLAQTYQNIQIVIVDQSEIRNKEYASDSKITYINIKEKGLSNARNVGLPYCTGGWVALIDDDAVYKSDYLSNAMLFVSSFQKTPGIVSGVGYDPIKKTYLISSMNEKNVKEVNWNNFFKYCMSAGMVIREDLIKQTGFDKEFGVGAGTLYGSGEESDVVIEALKRKEAVYFNPNMIFYHKADLDIDPKKSYSYNCGKGALLRKHFNNTNKLLFLRLFLVTVLRSAVGCLLYFVGRKQYRKSVSAIKGKIYGFFKYKSQGTDAEF